MADTGPKPPLRLLIIEDRADDVALVLRELRRSGLDIDAQVVDDEAGLLAHLSPLPDLILADYSLPQFDALRALEVLRQHAADVPVVVVSGSISEEVAVECILRGAADYVLKDRPARLGQAAIRAMGEAQLRRERHRADEARRLSESRFRGIFEASPIGIAIIQASGQVSEMNAACKAMLGIDPAPGSEAGLVLPPEPFPVGVVAGLAGGVNARFEVPLDVVAFAAVVGYQPRRTGIVHVDVLLTPLTMGGDPVYLMQLQDVTERRRLEAQLQQSQKMETIGLLAGGIAHDFNNLLTAISGYATFAKASLAADDPSLADLEEVLKASERAASLTGQLLAFARNRSPEMKLLDANELIGDMDRLFRRLIREDIELITQPADALWPVEADRGQLEQVLVNLVVNARDAMPAGGKLTIETRNTWLQRPSRARRMSAPLGEYVVLSVSDTGHGISAEAAEHLFEPFFTTKMTGQGTGLGLAVVYSVLQQHRGDICVRSEVGHGSTFEVYLPRAQADVGSAASRPGSGAQRGTETVLLAEDEPAVRRVAERMLRSLGYRVLVASDGEEAIRVAGEWVGRIDVLLTDVVMPRMSGRELAARLCLAHPSLRVLFASGYTDTPFSAADLTEHTDFVQKPFTTQTLGHGLRRLLDR